MNRAEAEKLVDSFREYFRDDDPIFSTPAIVRFSSGKGVEVGVFAPFLREPDVDDLMKWCGYNDCSMTIDVADSSDWIEGESQLDIRFKTHSEEEEGWRSCRESWREPKRNTIFS